MKNKIGIRDNRGVTLLEVIIAVSIFAVVAIVLLNGFYAAGRANKKSSNYQEATALGQSLLEGVKTKSLEEVALEFNHPWDKDKSEVRFSLLTMTSDLRTGIKKTGEGDSGGTVIREVNGKGKQSPGYSSIQSDDNGKTWKFLGQSTGQYYFQMQNVPVGKQRYDATITIDSVNSVTDDDAGGSNKAYRDSTKASKPNNYEEPLLENMDIFQDAIFMSGDYSQEDSVDNKALKTMMEKRDDYAKFNSSKEIPKLTLDELGADMKRDVKFTISKDATSTKVAVDYKVHSPTLRAHCPVGASEHNGMGECFCTYRSESVFFDNKDNPQALRNLYFIYAPNYASTSAGTGAKDQIVVHNPDNVPVTFQLIKQKMLKLTTPQLISAEQKYRVNVTIEESPKSNWNTLAYKHRGATKLRTNANSNIAYLTQEERDLKADAKLQMHLTYKAVKTGRYVDNSGGSSAAVYKITQMKNLQSKERKDRIYSVHVAIYEPGTLSGGEPSTWKDKQILTLDGAKEN